MTSMETSIHLFLYQCLYTYKKNNSFIIVQPDSSSSPSQLFDVNSSKSPMPKITSVYGKFFISVHFSEGNGDLGILGGKKGGGG